jgi:hypothetical protein
LIFSVCKKIQSVKHICYRDNNYALQIATIYLLHALSLRQIARRTSAYHANVGVRLVNKRTLTRSITKVARAPIVHFVIWEVYRVKHSFKVGRLV